MASTPEYVQQRPREHSSDKIQDGVHSALQTLNLATTNPSFLTSAMVTKQHFKLERQHADSKTSLDAAKHFLLDYLQSVCDAERLMPSVVAWIRDGDEGSSMECTTGDKNEDLRPWLLVGPYAAARDLNTLKRFNVSHIICVAAEGYPRQFENENIRYLDCPIVEVDCVGAEGVSMVCQVLDETIGFVDRAFSDFAEGAKTESSFPPPTILIHCLHGKTRSAAVACVLKSLLERKTFEESYVEMKRCRDVMVPEEWIAVLKKEVARLLGKRGKSTGTSYGVEAMATSSLGGQ